MKVYLNYYQHAFVLSHDALEMMGRPKYVAFFFDEMNREVLLVPMRSHRSDLGMTSIYEGTYREGGAYAVYGSRDLLYDVCSMAAIDGNYLCSVDAEPYYIDDLKAGECGLSRGIRVRGTALKLDLKQARMDFMEEYPIYTYGGCQIYAG